MKWLMIGFIKAWRLLISPLYGQVCRYYPSCSTYGLEAVQVHGAWRGGRLTVGRIARCNPWSAGGYDPVPGTPAAVEWEREQAEDRQRRRDFAADQLSESPANSHDEDPGESGGAPQDEALRVVPDEQTGRETARRETAQRPGVPERSDGVTGNGVTDNIDHRPGGATNGTTTPPAGNQR